MMNALRRVEVAFCGDSVYLGSLAAGLRLDLRLRVVHVDKSASKSVKDLKVICPDVVVAENVDAETLRVLRREAIWARIITVDAASDSFTVLDERESMTLSVTELPRALAACAEDTRA